MIVDTRLLNRKSLQFCVPLLCALVLVQGCAPIDLPSSELAPPQDIEKALKFEPDPDAANVYVYYDSEYAGFSRVTSQIKMGGVVVGKLNDGEAINFLFGEGKHDIVVHNIMESGHDWLVAKGQVEIEPGALLMLDCRVHDDTLPAGPLLTDSLGHCSGDALYKSNGVTACLQNPVERQLSWSQLSDKSVPRGACRITDDKALFSSATMVKPKWKTVFTPAMRFRLAEKAGTVEAYEKVIKSWPNGQYAKISRERIKEISARQAIEQYETRVREEITRSSRLPPQVRQDKYTVLLTNHLKAEEYSQALFYFDVLERIGAPQSPLFEFFWGEALLRTGKPKDAADKFYAYLNATGKAGEYYTRALQLLSEAESAL